MAENDLIELLETLEQKQDEEICPEAWAEGEVDLQNVTVVQFTDYMGVMEKILALRLEYHNIPRHVKLMKKAVRIFPEDSR